LNPIILNYFQKKETDLKMKVAQNVVLKNVHSPDLDAANSCRALRPIELIMKAQP
jgi:hypothetical protein